MSTEKTMIEPAKLSIKQTAAYTGVSVSYVRHKYPEWVARYGVRFHREGKKVLFNRASLDRMIERKETEELGKLVAA